MNFKKPNLSLVVLTLIAVASSCLGLSVTINDDVGKIPVSSPGGSLMVDGKVIGGQTLVPPPPNPPGMPGTATPNFDYVKAYFIYQLIRDSTRPGLLPTDPPIPVPGSPRISLSQARGVLAGQTTSADIMYTADLGGITIDPTDAYADGDTFVHVEAVKDGRMIALMDKTVGLSFAPLPPK